MEATGSWGGQWTGGGKKTRRTCWQVRLSYTRVRVMSRKSHKATAPGHPHTEAWTAKLKLIYKTDP